jgi:K+-transporting ATPase ATPase C chain
VARARGVPEEKVAAIIRKHIEPRTLWILGEPRVNVLLTNLDLDREIPTRP